MEISNGRICISETEQLVFSANFLGNQKFHQVAFLQTAMSVLKSNSYSAADISRNEQFGLNMRWLNKQFVYSPGLDAPRLGIQLEGNFRLILLANENQQRQWNCTIRMETY